MKGKDVKLTPPAYMHYMEKGWLDPNPHNRKIQCIDKDVKPPTNVYHIRKRSQAPQYVKYTQHESIYGGHVKLPLQIDKTYQQILKQLFKTIFLKFLEVNKMNFDTNEIKL